MKKTYLKYRDLQGHEVNHVGDCGLQKMTTKYIQAGFKSEGHTPIYKLHKYFARRPHNLFQALIHHYTKPGEIVFDCFGGGGVTLIEGVTLGRKVISYDLNPIASFVQIGQVAHVSSARFMTIAKLIKEKVGSVWAKYYTTLCRGCGEKAHVRWFERAYNVNCPECGEVTALRNDQKAGKDGGKPGWYDCQKCRHSFKVSHSKRIGSTLVSLRYKCACCGKHETATPSKYDYNLLREIEDAEANLLKLKRLKIPEDKIPLYWDRQDEDGLAKKGFVKFKDLFTPRNRIVSAAFFSAYEEILPDLNQDEKNFILLNLSSLLRYTNSMTFSVDGWMDGRPTAWSKHAYWMPNQFVECNPLEYFDNRIKASMSGIRDRESRFGNLKMSYVEDEVIKGVADFAVVNASSSKTKLPDCSVDAVITDPPYGSNVQYGELSHFWLVWIHEYLPFSAKMYSLESEAVVHRKLSKKSEYKKNFSAYQELLTGIFSECYRVLKPGKVMTFTFNNKNPEAWLAVLRSVVSAGFDLEEGGVAYQEQIDAYRDTAHLKYEGTAEGDYLYSFVKRVGQKVRITPAIPLREAVDKALLTMLSRNSRESHKGLDLVIECHKRILMVVMSYLQAKTPTQDSELLSVLSQDFTTLRIQQLTKNS
jgi:putative DNA methylase